MGKRHTTRRARKKTKQAPLIQLHGYGQDPVTRRSSPTPSMPPPRHHAILSSFFEKTPDHSDLQAFNANLHAISNQCIHRDCAHQPEYAISRLPSTYYSNIAKTPF